MNTLESISAHVSKALASIDYPSRPEGLYSPIAYALAGGGKRLRPSLTIAACKALGGDVESAMPLAVGIEIFHNFTLLHDDVMDKADVRRGLPTVHRRWNENTAILSGDAMLTMATMWIARCRPDMLADALDLFNRTAMEVYEGQQYDMDFESRNDVTVSEYIEMISLKTSVLLGCACALGAMAAGASAQVTDRMYHYGLNLGLAFQLQDDLLDTYGDPAVFGKAIGGDIRNDKKTWLRIMALTTDPEHELDAIAASGIGGDEKVERVRAVYDRLGLPGQCRALIEDYAAKARRCLEGIEMEPAMVALFDEIAAQAATRRK